MIVGTNGQVTEALPTVEEQAERLIQLGVPLLFGQTNQQLRDAAQQLGPDSRALLVPSGQPPSYSRLMELVELDQKHGFVVEDFTDAEQFGVFDRDEGAEAEMPSSAWYLLHDVARGDEFENASPAEALETITGAGRVPITMVEGIVWALQIPSVLERNHCFMTVASRKRKGKGKGGFDARTPALWISNGTGRDGRERKNAPKLGWCWWNNRHTWLGIAHAATRSD